MYIIFLDIDGVLNAECDFGGHGKPNPYVVANGGTRFWGICNTHVRHLKKIVDATGAKIVLVSSWKQSYEDYINNGYTNRVGKYLYNKLRKQGLEIYDTTLRYNSYGYCRGFEIESWLKDHENIDGWVVLDDEIFRDYTEEIKKHLIFTSQEDGLTEACADNAISILMNGEEQLNFTGTFEEFLMRRVRPGVDKETNNESN